MPGRQEGGWETAEQEEQEEPLDPEELPGVLECLQTMGLPNLFIPKKDDFIEVDKLPILGTGKTDLRAVKKTATDAFKVGP